MVRKTSPLTTCLFQLDLGFMELVSNQATLLLKKHFSSNVLRWKREVFNHAASKYHVKPQATQ